MPLINKDQGFMGLSSRISTYLSVGCAAHCIILPLAVALLPLLGEFAHHWWHTYLEPLELPTLILVVFLTGRQVFKNWSSKKNLSLALLILGTVIVGIGNQGFDLHSPYHPIFTILGICLLIAAQFKAHKVNHLLVCHHRH
jgi:hypothetical protein